LVKGRTIFFVRPVMGGLNPHQPPPLNTPLGAATDSVTIFFLEKTDNLFFFFSYRLCKVMTFLAVVSLPLPSFHVVYPVFFLNSATKNNFSRVSPVEGVTRGGRSPRVPLPSDATEIWPHEARNSTLYRSHIDCSRTRMATLLCIPQFTGSAELTRLMGISSKPVTGLL